LLQSAEVLTAPQLFSAILYRPEIPPNTGNIIRLCGNANAALHIVEPVGFDLSERSVRRAALDYDELAAVSVHPDLDACLARLERPPYVVTVNGEVNLYDVAFEPGDAFLFGNEGWGLPAEVEARFEPSRRLKIPQNERSRSLNLANAVAIVIYEARRQNGFAGLR